jgi:hypothetical protein
MRGTRRFRVKGKLAPRYVRPFKIIHRKGEMAYQLELPPELSEVHGVFHISQLKKCLRVPEEQLPMEYLDLGWDLTYKEGQSRSWTASSEWLTVRQSRCPKYSGVTTQKMRQRGSMKKSLEQITLNYSQALPESRGRDSFKGGRFVTPTFYK